MYWKKKLTGLPPNTLVVLTMEIQLASKYAEGLVGVGGAPGEGVNVKAGAVPCEPQAVVNLREGEWRMNLDKGNQANGGANMSLIGDVAKPDDGNENYVLLLRHHHGQPLTVTTASDGSLWLIFGTDSGGARSHGYHLPRQDHPRISSNSFSAQARAKSGLLISRSWQSTGTFEFSRIAPNNASSATGS